MASFKEIQNSRPLTTQRPSIATIPSSTLASRQSHARASSHSALSSSLSANHRVTRRKSVTNANVAAVAAAIREAGDKVTALPIAMGSRRNTMSKGGASRNMTVGSLPSPPASLPSHKFSKPQVSESAIDDDQNESSAEEADTQFQQARMRRASDGQPIAKEGGKRRPQGELKCEKCGKEYKHSSCLTKHLWEHTPEWSYTSKLLISKHQQVQLLEAASVLVAMNTSATTPPDSAKESTSDRDSASPAASGYSDPQDRASSADTTPPPQLEPSNPYSSRSHRLSYTKRYSSGSGFSRSYQTVPSLAESAPNTSGFGHYRQLSHERRPPSSGKNSTGQDDRDLAAAVELLSCSFGSNSGSRTVMLPADAPPVPPLPAQYLEEATLSGTSFSYLTRQAPESFTRGEMHQADVKMDESGDSGMEDDDDHRWHSRMDEDDDGVFGRMEE